MLPEPGEPPFFNTEEELIEEAMRFGSVMSLDEARAAMLMKQAKDALIVCRDPSSGRAFCERKNMLARWPRRREERRPVSPAALKDFLLSVADGTKSDSARRSPMSASRQPYPTDRVARGLGESPVGEEAAAGAATKNAKRESKSGRVLLRVDALDQTVRKSAAGS